ncbi:MAG: N4-gp56 family major capsid protein [Oscillospiraceae bacterium]|nr:MAG: N4-gp56 family major capsid protein [Oscillospiraceae bacterium]
MQKGKKMSTVTTTTLSAEMKTFYDMRLIDEASPMLVHEQFGQKRPIPQGGGKTVNFRRFSPLAKATTALTEGVTPSGSSLSVSNISAIVAQYGDYVVQSDVLELTAVDNTILETTKLLGRQAGLTMDTIVRNALLLGTNKSYAPKYVADTNGNLVETEVTKTADLDTSAKLTVDVVQRVVAKLRAQNAPTIGGDYVCIIHPYVAYDLMRDPEWIDAHKYATPENLYTGEIGKMAGVRFVQSTEAKIDKGGSDNPSGLAVFHCLFIGDGAYGVTEVTGGGLQTIVKQKGSSGTADPLDQRSSVGWKGLKAAKILVDNYLVDLMCCSKFSATATAN